VGRTQVVNLRQRNHVPPALCARRGQSRGLRPAAGGKGCCVSADPLRGPGEAADAPPQAVKRPIKMPDKGAGREGNDGPTLAMITTT
jgi:hypothetical protein